MEEIWKDIKGYEGLYQISNLGRVKCLPKIIRNRKYKEIIKSPSLAGKGYYRLILCNNGKNKAFYIHRLVAQAFIPNPNNLPQVNHKDENILNNCVDNLEWCNNKQNINYGLHNFRKYISLAVKNLKEKKPNEIETINELEKIKNKF